jgi:23S rRNA (cytosine1962-C5)-methyltransferase
MTDEQHDDWTEKSLEIMTEVLFVPKENIFLKLRQRKPGRLGQYQKYNEVQHEFVVEENQLKFIVNLSDYLDTGLFLDHRITRQMVREQSAGKKVLNLFAYTGSFSVYAAAGLSAVASSDAMGYGRRLSAKGEGAHEVVTVDLSNTYLKWAQRNMELNGFIDPSKYQFIQADVMQYLKTMTPAYYDIIIMDPPTFSNSKRMSDFLDIQRDHVELINDCLFGLKPGGVLYFSTNFRKFILDKEKIKASAIKDITKATTSFDFEGKNSRLCYSIIKRIS